MGKTLKQHLTDYHILIVNSRENLLTKPIIIEKIKKSPSVKEGEIVLDKCNSFKYGSRFIAYSEDEMTDTIKHNLEILEFFAIQCPAPPLEIAHLFVDITPQTPNSSPNILTKLNESLVKDMELNPEKYKITCTHCHYKYNAENPYQIYTCPLCDRSAED